MKIFYLLLTPLLLLADAQANAEFFGVWTLLPPVIAIVLAFITKDVVLSLFIGALSGTFMLGLIENNIYHAIIASFTGFISKVVNSMASSGNAGILLQVLTIGGVVALITKTGGTKAVALWLSTKAKQAKSSQFATWCMGIFIFFDDYANSLIVGPIMRPVTDKFKVSREKLAFIMDATAAPITGLAIISTWIGLEISLIRSGYDLIDDATFAHLGIIKEEINAFEIFVQTLPYRFYNLFMLIFVLLTIYTGREFGPMLKAELRARAGKFSHGHEQIDNVEDKVLEPKEHIKLQASNAIIPLAVLIIFSFIGFYFSGYNALEDANIKMQIDAAPFSLFAFRETFGAADASIVLFQAALLATIIAIILGMYRKIFTLKEAIATWTHGWRTMIMTVIILLCAWSLASVIKDLGTSKYLIDLFSDKTPIYLLPTAIFIFASIISFSTGTSYGTMGILMPLAIPLAMAVGVHNDLNGIELHQYMIINISGVLTGAIFGDHCSPISDTTILSSMGSKCDLLAHVSTQMPYALSVCAISILCGYLPVALGLNVWLGLVFGIIAMIALLFVVGKKVDA
ncbi:TPA: Na+/H+ antiporter NhaC family protein [Campylobacter lari]|uniref:Na+/H+ antiporter NhaC family protein n=1 Tax=Campylobacter lari TaxID=201 RepID=UPI0012867750|nr:Na+/H+ antiporter NhaC family protein [Campylobacter lari]EAH7187087.1 Na+/H+ antiporter NhaC family protein [Campylobacter lari]EAI4483185.1 Na+/H+ antiporter NhaC family protein [Campylobacter lari]EAI7268831.1 Na+/H+ antiporter NhaC family protein [Campylobacter lari]EAI8646161.1 Na+/H+ antiporter NhaC family protein [Campylobacter lari]EAJ1118916.1 Na+/H+ antiporter NhaC family protein [Campylobacter lari]